MREISPDFAEHLASGATTICMCWRVDPKFGPAIGFTDHDVDISFDGLVFEATSGFAASGLDQSLGLSIDNAAASGVLVSDKLSDEDISRGRFDGAEVRQWQVNWRDPAQRLLMFRGEFGEVKRGDQAFEVEIRGLSERLNRPVGRSYLPVCDAALGDKRCKFDVTQNGFAALATVESLIDTQSFFVDGLAGFETGWFTKGALSWTSGANAGETMGVRVHALRDGAVEIGLAREAIGEIAAGDSFDIVAGCDKRRATCRDKFSNILNFQGFPFTPGENWTTAYPVDGDSYQGGSRFG